MRLLFLLSLVLLATAAKYKYPAEWHLWKATHNKGYESEDEELQRHINWLSNKEYIEQHNKHADLFGHTLAMNQFGDMVNHAYMHSLIHSHTNFVHWRACFGLL